MRGFEDIGSKGHFSAKKGFLGQNPPGGQRESFSKIHLEHFFTFPKPYLTAKFQKKLMNGCLDICVTYVHL